MGGASFNLIGTNSFHVKADNERVTAGGSFVVKTLNLEISRCHLTEYVRELYRSACRTCSTIIFPHSANQIIDLWRCGCHCRRLCLSSRITVSSGANLYKREAHHQIRIQWSSGICSCLLCSHRKRCHRLSQHGRTHSCLNKATKQILRNGDYFVIQDGDHGQATFMAFRNVLAIYDCFNTPNCQYSI